MANTESTTNKISQLYCKVKVGDLVSKLPGYNADFNSTLEYTVDLYTCYLVENDCYKTARPICATENNKIQGIKINSADRNSEYLKDYVQPIKDSPAYATDNVLCNNTYDDLIDKIGISQSSMTSWNVARPDNERKCVHAFIGKNAAGKMAIVNTLPYNFSAWGCGINSANFNDSPNGRIQINVCSDDESLDGTAESLTKALDIIVPTAMYCAYLCMRLGINPSMNDNTANTEEELEKTLVGTALNKFGRGLVIPRKDSQFIYSGMPYTNLEGKSINITANDLLVKIPEDRKPPSFCYYATYTDNAGKQYYPMKVSDALGTIDAKNDWIVPTIVSHDEACALGLASIVGKFDEWLNRYRLDMNWFRMLVQRIYVASTDATLKYNDVKASDILPSMSLYNFNNAISTDYTSSGTSISNDSSTGVANNPSTSTSTPMITNTQYSNPKFDTDKFKNGIKTLTDGRYACQWKFPLDASLKALRSKDANHTVPPGTALGENYGYACAMYLSDISKYCDSSLLMTDKGKSATGCYYSLPASAVVGILGNMAGECGYQCAQFGTDVNAKPAGGLIAYNGFQIDWYYRGYCPNKTNKSVDVYNQNVTSNSKIECKRCKGVHTFGELNASKVFPKAPYEKGGFAQLVFFSNLFVSKTLGYSLPNSGGNNYNGFTGYCGSDDKTPAGVGMRNLLGKDYWQNTAKTINAAKEKGAKGIHANVGLIAQCWTLFLFYNIMHKGSADITGYLNDYMTDKLTGSNYIQGARTQWETYFKSQFGEDELKKFRALHVKNMTILDYLKKLPNTLAGAMQAAALFCIIAEKPQNATEKYYVKDDYGNFVNSSVRRANIAKQIWGYLS